MQFSGDADKNESLRLFAKWTLDIGDGKLGIDDDGEAVVDIPDDVCIQTYAERIGDIVESTYTYFLDSMNNSSFFKDQAILAPTLDLVEKVNDYVMSLIQKEGKEYFRRDTICKVHEDVGIDRRWTTTKFLNDIKYSGMPNHKLHVKVGFQ